MATAPPAEPQPAAPPAPPAEAQTDTAPPVAPTPPEQPPTATLTTLQWLLVALPLGPLLLLFLVLDAFYPARTALLWVDPLGQKLLAAEFALLLFGVLVCVGGFAVSNRFVPGPLGLVARGAIVALWCVGFCVPAGFVLVLGPTAVEIQRNAVLVRH
ncbi:hypothetical protein GobsT_61190 [Gemmata obscuriglobus]|uniref:hypothetical protein n=1 Tax=Gemmata obscuriglobus TaxID=114 RepID=UPI00016C5132|nr:hypothetical protein [Gemmata obscuriglobus]QEG31298.1 hypothetical protein GobsT_61190 [Gemmata obscuriglobus]VTS10637.1 unnamed protein product [Gemmata obscuriglobus UQM 2246]